MNNKFLPLGTVVKIKDNTRFLMITGYLTTSAKQIKQKKVFDYSGCVYPLGILDSRLMLEFNHDSIEKVIYPGYKNEEFEMFNQKMLENKDEIIKKYLGETEIQQPENNQQ